VTKNCKRLRKDLSRVIMEEYLNGNFKDHEMGHITDALGYLVAYRYPIRTTRLGMSSIRQTV